MKWIFKRQYAYLSFGIVYLMFWFLFKFGGWPELPRALYSTLIDIVVTMTALVVTIEILLPRFVYKQKYLRFIGLFFLLVLVAGSIIILSQMKLLNQSILTYQENIARHNEHYFYWFWADLIFGSYFMVFFISITGAGVRLAFERVQEANRAKQLESEKAVAELELLKEQINPHFLFNALNTIYYKIDRTNTDGRETLQQFSNMLRYQLYECDKPLVEIEKELLFIESYIQLQKERLGKNYEISYEGFDEMKEFSVSPFLLLPLVENCFKHISHGENQRNFVSLRCVYHNNIFIFETTNSVSAENGIGNKGVGISNIKKRLQLLFPGKHELTQSSSGNVYTSLLKLNIA